MTEHLGCVLVVVGTRPEAIKMAPVVRALRESRAIRTVVCFTGQHHDLVSEIFAFFGVEVDFSMDGTPSTGDLVDLISRLTSQVSIVFHEVQPDILLCHGDTASAYAAAQVGFLKNIPVGHVEAGLRTYKLQSPFPEEFFRQSIDRLSTICYCPTVNNKQNVDRESGAYQLGNSPPLNFPKLKESVVVGNTIVDAVNFTLERIETETGLLGSIVGEISKSICGDWLGQRYVVITCHRRENIKFMADIFRGLSELAQKFKCHRFIHILHPNPIVTSEIKRGLSPGTSIQSIKPLKYQEMIYLLSNSAFVITDSGGLQEESVALNVPTFVLREDTERMEAVATGMVKIVGSDPKKFLPVIGKHIAGEKVFDTLEARNPFGIGNTSQLILESVLNFMMRGKSDY